MIERRALERIRLDQLVLLSFNGIPGVHPCLLKDFHSRGAGLYSDSFHFFANDFVLSFDGFKSSTRCRVVWRRGSACGVEFPGGYLGGKDDVLQKPGRPAITLGR